MTREGLDSALAQYFAGADRNHDGRLDRGEAAEALGFAQKMLSARRDEEPFVMEVDKDGQARLSLNENGPLGQAGLIDAAFGYTDRNHDGALSLAEVQATARERFDAVDRDHDGILDEAERAAAKRQFGMLNRLLGTGP